MRILIPVFSPATGTWGGLTRILAIADAAQARGHELAFCASGDLEQALRRHGCPVYPAPPTTMFGLPASLSRVIERRSQRVTPPIRAGHAIGNIWFVYLISGMARSGYLRRLVETQVQAARDFKPDLLFTDVDPAAFLTAHVTGLPIASTFQGVMLDGVGSFAWQMMRRAVGAVLKTRGQSPQRPETLYYGPQVLKIIPSIPELDGTDPNRRDVRYVGHLLGAIEAAPPPDFALDPARRYVFVYVGTGAVSQTTLRDVLPRLFPADGPTVCLVGAQSQTRVERLGGVEFRPYVPAEATLAQCDWTICHGGQNTIIQSLRQDVPLLIFPGPIFERRFNAERVQAAGAGRMGELPDFNVEWLSQALAARDEVAAGAARLGAQIRGYGGAPAAVDALEAWGGRD